MTGFTDEDFKAGTVPSVEEKIIKELF
jgi:hypothetical protein